MPINITALTDPDRSESSFRLVWLASDDDANPTGSAYLRVFTKAGQDHLAELSLNVHPGSRRQGVATDLLDAVLTAARAADRRSVLAQTEAGTPGEGFLAARCFRKVLTLTYARLALAEADLRPVREIAEWRHPGYRLESWQGTVSDALVDTYVNSRRAMDDMPMDDTDYGTVAWDADRVRSVAKVIAKRGEYLHTVVAIDESDGSIAGFTELVVPADGKGDAQHYGTGVLPEHRGHDLGRWMKAAAIVQARQTYPDLAGLLTDTADSNTHMRAINDALGYLPTHKSLEYQFDL